MKRLLNRKRRKGGGRTDRQSEHERERDEEREREGVEE